MDIRYLNDVINDVPPPNPVPILPQQCFFFSLKGTWRLLLQGRFWYWRYVSKIWPIKNYPETLLAKTYLYPPNLPVGSFVNSVVYLVSLLVVRLLGGKSEEHPRPFLQLRDCHVESVLAKSRTPVERRHMRLTGSPLAGNGNLIECWWRLKMIGKKIKRKWGHLEFAGLLLNAVWNKSQTEWRGWVSETI